MCIRLAILTPSCSPPGIIPQAIEQLFALLEATAAEKLAAEEDYSFKVSASAMEVYNEELKDLGPSVQGSQQEQAASPEPNKRPMSARGQGPSRGQQAKLELRDNRNKQTGFSTEVLPSKPLPPYASHSPFAA